MAWVLPALLSVLAFPGHAVADETLALTTFISDISAGSGVVLYSAYDSSTERYRLMRIVNGRAEQVPIKPSRRPFQADVGPTASGHAFYVYIRCTKRARSCDLYTFNPVTGREQRSKASDPKHDEATPTYWRGRLAFVRSYGPRRSEVVYQRPNARTRRSQRLPGAPRQRCQKGVCIDPDAEFFNLELHGRFLAQTLSADGLAVYDAKPSRNVNRYRTDQIELRLVNIRSGRSTRLAARSPGETGKAWSGLAIDRGSLYAAFTCFSVYGPCSKSGIFRYDLESRRFAFSRRSPPLAALAVADGETYELRNGDGVSVADDGSGQPSCDGNDLEPAGTLRCKLIRRDPPPVFAPIPAP